MELRLIEEKLHPEASFHTGSMCLCWETVANIPGSMHLLSYTQAHLIFCDSSWWYQADNHIAGIHTHTGRPFEQIRHYWSSILYDFDHTIIAYSSMRYHIFKLRVLSNDFCFLRRHANKITVIRSRKYNQKERLTEARRYKTNTWVTELVNPKG